MALPVLAAGAATAARGTAMVAGGAARGGAKAAAAGGAIAGEIVSSFVGGGNNGGNNNVERIPPPPPPQQLALPAPDVIEGDYEVVEEPGKDVVKVEEDQATAIESAIEKLPTMELNVHDAEAVERLKAIEESTAETADAVNELVDQSKPLMQGPEDTTTDPNAGKADGPPAAKATDSPFMKSIKGIFKKFSLFMIAAAAIMATLMGPGGGQVFEKLKEAFAKIKEALTPIIEYMVNNIVPIINETLGNLLEGLGGLIENVLAPGLEAILPVVTAILGFIADIIGYVTKFFTDPIGYIQDGIAMIGNWVDGIIIAVADFFNGLLNGIADIVENIPFVGKEAAEELRGMAVLGEDARARVEQRNEDMTEREANRQIDRMGEIDLDSSPEEFFNAVQERVSSGEIPPDVGQAMINAYNQEQAIREMEGQEAQNITAQLEAPAPAEEPQEPVQTPQEQRRQRQAEAAAYVENLNAAKASGLYTHNMVGDSEVNYDMLPGAPKEQLDAILQHGDLSDQGLRAVNAELASREQSAQLEEGGAAGGQGDQVEAASTQAQAAQEEAQFVGPPAPNVATVVTGGSSTNVTNSRTTIVPNDNSLNVPGRGALPFGAGV